MAVEYSLFAEKYQDKERIVTALTNNGYIVSTVKLYDGIKPCGYRIDIYSVESPSNEEKSKIGYNTNSDFDEEE